MRWRTLAGQRRGELLCGRESIARLLLERAVHGIDTAHQGAPDLIDASGGGSWVNSLETSTA